MATVKVPGSRPPSCIRLISISLDALPPERAAWSELRTSPGGLAQDSRAAIALHLPLGMAEYREDLVASWTFYIHEVGVRMLHKPLQLAFAPLLNCRGI